MTTANQMIELAKLAGYGIGRRRSNVYYYAKSEGVEVVEREFRGTWPQFVKFFKEMTLARKEVA